MVLYFSKQGLDQDKSLNEHDWKLMAQVNAILRPMYLFTLELSSEKTTTLSKIIPMVNLLLDAFSPKSDDSKVAKECRQLIHDAVQKQFDGIESSETYATSTILDPRFKNLGFSNGYMANQAVNQAKSIAVSNAKDEENGDEFEFSDDDEITVTTKTKVIFRYKCVMFLHCAKVFFTLGSR